MKIGLCGLGKLGFPVALGMESKGHSVLGYDPIPTPEIWPYIEDGLEELRKDTKVRNVSLAEVIEHSEIVFVAVQTPHEKELDGSAALQGREVKDFDYSYLVNCAEEISEECYRQKKYPVIAIISTVTPGTIRRLVLPLIRKRLVYCPFFVAMGTVIHDLLDPEFVLIGSDHDYASFVVENFFKTLHGKPVKTISIESAELTKLAYNLFISTKICMANTLMEIAHKIPGCNIDEVTDCLSLATYRLLSPSYMRGGMVDSGPCHGRDPIAMASLEKELELSWDVFGGLIKSREAQAGWLADLAIDEVRKTGYPLVLLGKSFKPNLNITAGSAALLVADILRRKKVTFTHDDPIVDRLFVSGYTEPKVILLLTAHSDFKKWKFAKGTVVIDPFRYLPEQEGIRIVKVGIGQ